MCAVSRPRPRFRASPTAAIRSHGVWARRHLRQWVPVLRALAAVLVLQVSGFAHPLADAVFHDDCAADCSHEGSSGSGRSSECPPGCPTCHACSHGQAMYVPRAIGAPVPPAIAVTPRPDESDRAPTLAFRDSVYRPPRA